VQWLNEPAQWSEQRGSLVVTAGAATDFWRITGYGYVRDNGRLYAEQVSADVELSMRVRGSYGAQYDQAGAMCAAPEGSGFQVTFDDLKITGGRSGG
jgi:uncharacterized protein